MRGLLALIATTILWGSSFPVIKIVVGDIGGYSYTWIRSSIAVAALAPYVVYRGLRRGLRRDTVFGGLVTGVAYALGLWLQGWGTGLTTASNSAFITGLNVVFVHLYVAMAKKSYSLSLAMELGIAVAGLYLLTSPSGGLGIGDMLVLLSAVAWAAQVVLVSRYGGREPVAFTFFEMVPALAFVVHDLVLGMPRITGYSLAGLAYLGLACSDAAFALQAYGQRYVGPEIAALVFLLEPVFAAVFAWMTLGETMNAVQAVGAALIVLSIAMASRSTARAI